MRSNTNNLENNIITKDLKIIKDVPLFEEGYDEKQDSFDHKVYADSIIKLITSNKPPLSIGLFGPWGSGKSSILNTVKNEIENKNFTCVYFNAWKYAGDSFRRQFLLNTIDQLFVKEERETALRTLEQRFFRELPKTDTLLKKISSVIQKCGLKFNIGGLSFSFPIETDPRLVLPEQFEREFRNILDVSWLTEEKHKETASKIKNKYFLFIIDDIDRCPPDTVIEILNSVKTFLTPKNTKCYFILALDDKAVISELQKRNENYCDEELLKFFDVTVRMNPLMESDLVLFANRITQQFGLRGRVIQIAVYAGFNTPRKVKHFLNVLLVRFESARKRFEEGFLTEAPNLNQLAKLLVLEIKFPHIFKMILEDFTLIQNFQQYSNDFFTGKKAEIPEDFRELNELYKFLRATRYITIDNPSIHIYLKLSQSANALIKTGVKINELTDAIDRCLPDKLIELTKAMETETIQSVLVDFLEEKIEPASDIFLDNIMASALHIFKNLKLSENLQKDLSSIIVRGYLKESSNIFNLTNIDILFECIDTLEQKRQYVRQLGSRGLALLEGFKEPQKLNKDQILNISKFINNLYLREFVDVNNAKRINKSLKSWVDDPQQLMNVLESIEITHDDLKERSKNKNLIPDKNVLTPLICKISTRDEQTPLYERIKSIILRFWQNEYLKLIDEKLDDILTTKVHQVSTITPLIKFSLETILDLPEWIGEDKALSIAQQIWDFYSKCQQPDEKDLSIKAYLITTYSVPEAQQQSSLINQFLNQLQILDKEQYDDILKFITEQNGQDEESWWRNIETDFIRTIFEFVIQNVNNPNYAIPSFEFVWKKRIKYLDLKHVERMFKKLLNHRETNNNVFPNWKDIIITYVPKINKKRDGFLSEICNDLKGHIEDIHVQPSIADTRRLDYLTILTSLAKVSLDKSIRLSVAQFLLSLLGKEEKVLQNLGIESLSEIQKILDEDFGIYLSSCVKELCNNSVKRIANIYQESILKTIDFQENWDPEALNGFSDMVLSCITNQDHSIQDLGHTFLEKTSKLSPNKKKEITVAIKHLSLKDKEKWEPILSNKKDMLNRKLVNEYFKNNKNNKVESEEKN